MQAMIWFCVGTYIATKLFTAKWTWCITHYQIEISSSSENLLTTRSICTDTLFSQLFFFEVLTVHAIRYLILSQWSTLEVLHFTLLKSKYTRTIWRKWYSKWCWSWGANMEFSVFVLDYQRLGIHRKRISINDSKGKTYKCACIAIATLSSAAREFCNYLKCRAPQWPMS